MNDISDDDHVTGVNQALMAQLFKRAGRLIQGQEDAAALIDARTAALQAAGDRLTEILQRMVQAADTLAAQKLAGHAQAGNSEVVMRQLLAEAFRGQGQELAKVINQADAQLADRLAENRGAGSAVVADRLQAILHKLNATESGAEPIGRNWIVGVVLATAVAASLMTALAFRFF